MIFLASFNSKYSYFGMMGVRGYTIIPIYFYQQPGDAKKPYFVQYSAVWEDAPVIES